MIIGIDIGDEYPVYTLRPHVDSADYQINVEETEYAELLKAFDAYYAMQDWLDSRLNRPFYDHAKCGYEHGPAA